MKRLELSGQRVGRLLVIEATGSKDKWGSILWRCLCDCGGTKDVASGALNAGQVSSCGCLSAEAGRRVNFKHGQYKSPTYKSWQGMWQRCTNRAKAGYVDYGARGISVCERWKDFEQFLVDMGDRQPGLSLDRIDNDGNYEPANCRWATPTEQSNNTRRVTRLTVQGVTKTLHEWARDSGINPRTLQKRLNSGWSHRDAVTRPVNQALAIR